MKYSKPLWFTLGLLLLRIGAPAAEPLAVNLDVARTGAPINPHIYGQFIEHLGRCIYGGIWAEMLEDRKFYFPITANYAPYNELTTSTYPVVGASPWQIMGDPAQVTMVEKGAFVGSHSPRLTAGGGIRQRDLGVVANQSYDGYVWAQPLKGRAEIEVSLVWGTGAQDRATQRLTFKTAEFSKQPFKFTAKVDTDKGAALEIKVVSGDVLLGPPSIMPANNVHGMRADTLALLKQLNGTIYRWPGGNFVSGYDWRDGIGDRDRRPPRKNPAWTGVEHNDFGTDEFIAFCREIGTEPMIAANTGYGDQYSAAQWVDYCNSGAATIGGSWRAKNGHAAPFAVKYWCVGNEMFGPWQLGYMQLHQYAIKHNLVADAMWKADPSLILSGVGDLDTIPPVLDPGYPRKGIAWSQGMLEQCADHMTVLSEHFYRGRVPWNKEGRTDVVTHVGMLRESIRKKADGHRQLQASLPNLHGRIVPIAMDEWNYWHREYAYGELGCVYELSDGLGVAAGLHEFFRQSDIIHMAHYAQTVNVIGAIKTTKTAAEMETTGLVLQMYRAHFGRTPLKLAQDFGPVDVVAALAPDGKTLTVGVVNPTDAAVELSLHLTGGTLQGAGNSWLVTGANDRVHNTPGQPRVVDIRHDEGVAANTLKVPPLSATVFALPLK
ncbi:MAG: alpha-L-arabinofuranosidase C-terminal domain-containing protein [Opitutus sp.]